MSQIPFDFSAAREERDKGIKQAAEHAGRGWMERAVEDFGHFVKMRGEATLEQWRYDWLGRGCPPAVTHNAYGAVANHAARRGLVVNTRRYVKAQSKKTHAHPVPIWRPA